VSIDWSAYEVFDPRFAEHLHAATRGQARTYFRRLMSEGPQRLDMLRRLTAQEDIAFDRTEGSVNDLEAWYRRNVERDPVQPDELRGRWLSVSQDIALYLSQIILRSAPHLRWELDTGGRTRVSYQRPVLVGFGNVRGTYKADLTFAISQYGIEVLEDPTTPDGRFAAIVKTLLELA
jgi:hypothetical protein